MANTYSHLMENPESGSRWKVWKVAGQQEASGRRLSAISCNQMDLESAMQTSQDNNEMEWRAHSENLITEI